MRRSFALLFFAIVLAPSMAHPQIIKHLDFDVDGVLPSAEADVEFFTNSGNSEAALYSVAGGLLKQSTLSSNGNSSYGFPNSANTGGSLSSALVTVIETRFQLLSNAGTGGFIQA